MKTKLLAVSAAALMMMGLFGAANATAQPGPNGNNNFGLCTAYSSGSDTGQANKRNAPPFVALAQEAEDRGFDSVEEYCAQFLATKGKSEKSGGRP